MEIVAIWLVLAVVVGGLAAAKGRSGFGWFLLAAIISSVIAGLLLLIAGDNRPNRCPYCDERIKERATICPHCRNEIGPIGKIVIEGDRR